MSEIRKKGWHPDPFGIFAERYYYADDMPGQLVRDERRNESYDEVPASSLPQPLIPTVPLGQLHEQSPLPREPAPEPAPEQRAPTPGPPPPTPDFPVSLPQPRETPSQAVSTVGGVREPSDEGYWPDEPSHFWSQFIDKMTRWVRRYWAILGVCALVVAMGVAFLALLPGTPQLPATLLRSHVTDTTHGSSGASSGLRTTNPDGSATPSTASGPPTAWRITATFPHSTLGLDAIACPTVTMCEAVGVSTLTSGFIIGTVDGGAAWTQQAVPAGVGELTAIACPSATTCLAVGGTTVLATADAGMHWAVQSQHAGSLSGISCASVQVCVAVGHMTTATTDCVASASYATTNGGATWTATPLPCFESSGLSCPTTTECVAVGDANRGSETNGEVLVTRTLGARWQVEYKSDQRGSRLVGVSCATAQTCVAVGLSGRSSIVGTNNGGTAWLPQPLPSPIGRNAYTAVFCRTSSICQAVGSAPPVTTGDGGTSWVRQSLAPVVGKMTGVACPSDINCAGVGDVDAFGVSGVTLSLLL